MPTIHHTKTGQPYIILASGKARFIKKSASHSRGGRHSHRLRRRGNMARKRSYRRSSGLFGNRMVKGALIGAGIAYLTGKPLVTGAIGGAAGSALLHSDIGAAAGGFAAPMFLGGLNLGSGASGAAW